MKIKHLLLGLLISLLVFGLSLSAENNRKKSDKKKEICLTFDELPASSGFHQVDREAVTYLILETLKRHDIKAAGFVVGNTIEGAFDILGEWLNNGHVLGNMTYTNQDYHQTLIEPFLDDIKQGHDAIEPMLAGFGQKKRYFRFPYLHYGNDITKKEQVDMYLDQHNYTVAHTTIVIDDYLYNLSLEKLGQKPDSADFEELMNEYVNHVMDQVEQSEALSIEMLNRPCRQILQLRANRVNAVYLEDLIYALKEAGYEFITLDKALQDELYRKATAYFGSKGVGYLNMLKYSDPDYLPAE